MAPPTTAQREAYIKSLDDLGLRFDDLDHETIKRLVQLLQETRRGLSEMLLAGPTEFGEFRLTQLRGSVDSLIVNFERQLQPGLNRGLAGAAEIGGASVVEPLAELGVSGAFNTITPAQLNIASDFSAELIKNVGDDMRSKINGQLRLSVLGQDPPFVAMQKVTDILGVKARDGVWGTRNRPEIVKGVAARAEAIIRTEMTRMHNLGHFSQLQVSAKSIPGIRKRWQATGDRRTRRTHLATHRETFSNPIPIDQKFKVGNSKLLFPGDPRGSAGETVNCRCRVVTVHPDIGVLPTPQDDKLGSELVKRKARPLKAPASPKPQKPADSPFITPDRPLSRKQTFTPQHATRKREHRENLKVATDLAELGDKEFIREFVGESRDLITLEEDMSLIATQFDFDPATMSAGDWLELSEQLETETGRLLKFSTETRRIGIGQKARGPATDIIQLGGQDRLVKRGAITAKDADKIARDLARDAKERATNYLQAKLVRLGYNLGEVSGLSLEQRRRLLAEVGHGIPQKAKIGRITKGKRGRVVAESTEKQRLEALSNARNPTTAEGLDLWELYNEATKRAGLDRPPFVPDELHEDTGEDIPGYVLQAQP